MSQPSANTTLKTKGGNIKISALHNKKMQSTIVYIKFRTSQKELLSMMLQKYIQTKLLDCGININNSIYNAISGEDSIVIFCAENKCIQNISLLYVFLMKNKLTSQQAKCISSGDYNKLASDLSSFEVKITGKCKNVCNWLGKSDNAKLKKLVADIDGCSPAGRDKCSGNSEEWSVVANGCGNDTAMMYLSVACGDIPCVISKSGQDAKIKFLSCDGQNRFADRMFFKDILQAKIKTFIGQSGNPGSPPANDNGQYKQKCKYILECQNEIAAIYSQLRGFDFAFGGVDELKKVDSEAMSKIRGIKIKM